MMLTLDNIREELEAGGVVQKERLYNPEDRNKPYMLLKDVQVMLSWGKIVTIPAGFKWDLSSVPRLFWPVCPPDGDFEIAALIHDYLYRVTDEVGDKYCKRLEADKEMYIWSKKTNNTKLIHRIDNWIRWRGVQVFGWLKW